MQQSTIFLMACAASLHLSAQPGTPLPKAPLQTQSPRESMQDDPPTSDLERRMLEQSISSSVRFGAVKGNSITAEIGLQNLSGKTITAYDVRVAARYADGDHTERGEIADLLVETALARMPGVSMPSSRGTLNPYETHRMQVVLPLDKDGAPPSVVSATAAALVFEDRTAIGRRSSIQLIMSGRKQTFDDDSYVVAAVQNALSRPEVQAVSGKEQAVALRSALGSQIAESKKTITAGDGAGAKRIYLLQAFYDMLANGRPGFDFMMSTYEVTQKALAEQSILEVAK